MTSSTAFASCPLLPSNHSFVSSKPTHRPSFPPTVRQKFRPTCSAFPTSNPPVVLSGGTGFIGASLILRLLETSFDVVLLARDVPSAERRFSDPRITILAYDATQSPLPPPVAAAVASARAVVNLAGEPVDSGRWTAARKRALWDSRVTGTSMLARAVAQVGGVLVQASAVGYYGASESERFTEDAGAGPDFLGRLAKAWENAAWRHTRAAPGARTVILRIGVVLGEGGGALQKMKQAFSLFLGGPPGSGKQWFSFVHREDVVDLILEAIIDEKWAGTYNATAPKPVRLSEFCAELARVMGRPNWLPVPAIAVKALVGSEAADLILAGQQVDSSRAQANGFRFRHPTVRIALESILGKKETVAPRRM